MKWNQFFGGSSLGWAFGLLIGAATVRSSYDGSSKSEDPFGPALLLAFVGGMSAGGRALFPSTQPSSDSAVMTSKSEDCAEPTG